MLKTKKIAAAVVILGSLIPSLQAMAQSAVPAPTTTATGDSSAMGSGMSKKATRHMKRQQKMAASRAKRMSEPGATGAGRPTTGGAATPAAASGAGS